MALASRREARRLLEAIRLATSSRNGLTSLLKISNGGTEPGHVLIVAFGEAWPFQLLLAELGQRIRPQPNSARICSAVTPSPVARPSIPAIPEPIHPRGLAAFGVVRRQPGVALLRRVQSSHLPGQVVIPRPHWCGCSWSHRQKSIRASARSARLEVLSNPCMRCMAHQKFADRWGYTKQVEIVGMTAQLVVPA